MGQFLNYISRAFTTAYAPATAPAPVPATSSETGPGRSAKPVSPLLNLPADILLLLCDHLDTPAAVSLALTCRSTYALCFTPRQRKLRLEDKRQLLLLLEPDPFARGCYFCHTCVKLHPFQPTWGPRCEDEARSAPRVFHCGNRDRFSPIGNPYELTYTHARLAMNRHLYGPAHGIPLQNLEVDHVQPHGVTSIRCSTAARILGGELFIRRTYGFTVPAGSVSDFRRCTGARDFRLCEHTSFFSNSSVYRQYVPELQRPAWSGDDAFVACANAPGSCGLCLMDYDITIAPCPLGQDAWIVAITVYHQLGECRSPDDWKWARFTEARRPHLFFPNRPNRRSTTYYPGVVKKRWCEGDTPPPCPQASLTATTPTTPTNVANTANTKKITTQLTFPGAWAWLWNELKRPLVGLRPVKLGHLL